MKMLMPGPLLDRWQAAYSAYSTAATTGDRSEMARLSANVAGAWREMASLPGLEWWLVAALSAAAEAFEQQTRDWSRNNPLGRSSQPTEPRNGSHHRRESDDWSRSPRFESVR